MAIKTLNRERVNVLNERREGERENFQRAAGYLKRDPRCRDVPSRVRCPHDINGMKKKNAVKNYT